MFALQAVQNLRQTVVLSWREQEEVEERRDEWYNEAIKWNEQAGEWHKKATKLDKEVTPLRASMKTLAETGAIRWLLKRVLAGTFRS